jgi:hypothetical protein
MTEYSPSAESRAYKAFADLINFFNKKNKNTAIVSKEDIDDTFIKFIDYIKLNRDHGEYVDAMNLLADPKNMQLVAQAEFSATIAFQKKMIDEHIAELLAGTGIPEEDVYKHTYEKQDDGTYTVFDHTGAVVATNIATEEEAKRIAEEKTAEQEAERKRLEEEEALKNAAANKESKKILNQELIGIVWERLAKEGITNADSITGTRATIDDVDFDKFWSNVTKEDLENLKKVYETEKQKQLDLYDKFKGAFDPSTGTITSNDTSFFDNKIKVVDAELTALNNSANTQADIKRKNIFLKKANLENAPEFAQKAIAKTVEAIDEDTRLKVIERAYAGITADFISKELNLTTEQVRSIRTYYGVPDIADKIEYENWKKSIDAELAALNKTVRPNLDPIFKKINNITFSNFFTTD